MSTHPHRILLSFDIEEFDVPREHGVELPMEEQVRISVAGSHALLDVLKKNQVRATLFCTANFAQHAPEIIQRILSEGHELASHGYYHWTFEPADLKKSKDALEALAGVRVRGYRQARMMPVPEAEIYKAGYSYNTSLNPTFIPGRYMHLGASRTYFMKEGVLQIPASVTPLIRFPLFWLSCHIVRNNSGRAMVDRLDRWIAAFKREGADFITYSEFTDSVCPVKPATEA